MAVPNPNGRPKGSSNKNNKAIKDTIEKIWHRVNDGKLNGRGIPWLEQMAYEQPSVFASVVMRIIPPPVVEVSVNHNINLADAMLVASERLRQLDYDTAIDVTPTSDSSTTKQIIDHDKIVTVEE